jgi:hypothetical protein
MVDQVVHYEAAESGDARHGEERLPSILERPLLRQGIVRGSRERCAGLLDVFIKLREGVLTGREKVRYELRPAGRVGVELKVRPNLTMNLGVRYEYYTVMTEADGHIAVVDFACGGFCPPGTPMYSPDRNNFAPRVSMAWLPGGADGRTTIRTGFAMYYNANQNDDFSDPHESTAARYALSSADVPDLSYPLAPFLGTAAD